MNKNTLQLECFGVTDIGLVRERNQDVWAAYPEIGLFILADGMGGHAAGEVASSEAVEYLKFLVDDWQPSCSISSDDAKIFFKDAFVKVNSLIFKKGLSSARLKGMGTTLISFFFLKNSVVVSHVGDSRAYRKRDGVIERLTEDHSLVGELLSLGAIKEEEANSFPYKHILTRAIGTNAGVEPCVHVFDVEQKDLFLLCSDGLTNSMIDDEITTLLNRNLSLSQKGLRLIDLSNERGGGDNITLILVQVPHDLSR